MAVLPLPVTYFTGGSPRTIKYTIAIYDRCDYNASMPTRLPEVPIEALAIDVISSSKWLKYSKSRTSMVDFTLHPSVNKIIQNLCN